MQNQRRYAQYMTPAPIARFMAGLFPRPQEQELRLLDPGAGLGSLSCALFERFSAEPGLRHISLDAYEIDPALLAPLQANLSRCAAQAAACHLTWQLHGSDFIHAASELLASQSSLWPQPLPRYTHCIMNPPYKKLASSSSQRVSLRRAGIETVNLYSAFVALALLLLEDQGLLLAIIPRSFCNGAYYLPFRRLLLSQAAIRHIHLFESRNSAFRNQQVLQENIIIMLQKGAAQGPVRISASQDDSFSDLEQQLLPFAQVVKKNERQLFIHIPDPRRNPALPTPEACRHSLDQLGIQVSTGPVVSFRLRRHLLQEPAPNSAPLLYPAHFKQSRLHWPQPQGKRPNAIAINPETEKHLFPGGYYVVLRRFSSKEEKRRLVASLLDPALLPPNCQVSFENHLNVFHQNKKPLDKDLALGLTLYLNSSLLDQCFRSFSGHTQVNVSDLKTLPFPSRDKLKKLAANCDPQQKPAQEQIDQKIMELLTPSVLDTSPCIQTTYRTTTAIRRTGQNTTALP